MVFVLAIYTVPTLVLFQDVRRLPSTWHTLYVDRLHDLLGESRRDAQAILQERLRSLDSINLKLLEPRQLETPDLAKLREQGKLVALQDATRMTMERHRAADRAIDLAVISELRNRNRARVTTQHGLEGNPPGAGTMPEGGPTGDGTSLRAAQADPGSTRAS